MVLLIDTNILIDSITIRDEKSHFSADIITFCAAGKIRGYVAPHSLSNMYYILRKQYSDSERRRIIERFSKLLTIVNTDSHIIDAALNNKDISDFEDAIQYACAESVGADYIVTRNIRDFGRNRIRTITPEELLKHIEKGCLNDL